MRTVFRLKNYSRAGDRFFVQLCRLHCGHAQEPHLHDFVEIMYLLSGAGVNYVDGVPYPILPGDLYFINRGSTHAFKAREELVYYNLMFQPSEFSGRELRLLRKLKGFAPFFFSRLPRGGDAKITKIFLPPPFAAEVGGLFDRMCDEDARYPELATLNRKANLRLLLGKIWRAHQMMVETPGIASGAGAGEGGGASAFLAVMNYVNANFCGHPTLDGAAAAAHLSASYIGEFFRERTGVPLMKYVNSLRMEKARILLTSEPGLGVAEVAAACGVADSSYFTRMFHAATGCSPVAYRRNYAAERKDRCSRLEVKPRCRRNSE